MAETIVIEGLPESPKAIKSAADSWGKTIAAVLTAGGALTLVQGDHKLDQLDSGPKTLAVVALAAVLILAVSAVILAFLVSADDASTSAEVQNHRLPQMLYGSIGATVAALAALVIAICAIGFGDTKEGMYLVTDKTTGAISCGRLTTGTDHVVSLNGVAVANVASIEAVEKCPGDD